MKSLIVVCALLLVLPCMAWAVDCPVPDTGQIKCYDDSVEITCPSPGEPFYGQDVQYITNPQSCTKLDANSNDLPDTATEWVMVKDNVTGLIWELKTDDDSIHDKDDRYSWQDAQDVFIDALNTANFGGYDDWRMPNITELSSLFNSNTPLPGPTINTEYFPNTVSSIYWSSTSYAINPGVAWYVSFANGYMLYFYYNKSNTFYVRAVRGGQCESFDDFIDNGDGTVTDTNTDLMWQQVTAPGNYVWEGALTYCEGLSLAGHDDWRLPNRNELQSIVDYSTDDPAIDKFFFPVTKSDPYWASTSYAINPSTAWGVDFGRGGISGNGTKSNTFYVRAVRGGQCGSFGDSDDDGICDDEDNCPTIPNGPNLGTCSPDSNIPAQCTADSKCECQPTGNCSIDQEDTDSDGVGDVCDNCPNNCNYDQWDADVDGIGDVCDPDPGCGKCDLPECEVECFS
jgi:hypothetical protein